MYQTFKIYGKVIAPYAKNSNFLYAFSQFKTKILKVYNNQYKSISQLYDSFNRFQKKLLYVQKLKYQKQVESIQKKIKRVYKKTSTDNFQTHNQQLINPKLSKSLDKPLDTTISHQIFYNIQTQQYKPIDQQILLNFISLKELFQIVVKEKSMFSRDFQSAFLQILSNPSVNEKLYEKIKVRCSYFQQQLCLNVYEQYGEVLKQNQQNINAQGQNRKVLNKLTETNTKNKQAVFTQDFKFNIAQSLTSEQNYYASQISKTLVKYGFVTQKAMIFALKSLSNEGYKTLSISSLKNHLFVLGYFKHQIVELNEHLYKIFDMLAQNENSDPPQYLGHIGPLNSLLFYVLVNKIQNYQLLKSILSKIVKQYKNMNVQVSSVTQNQRKSIQTYDKQLYFILLKVLKMKYSLTFESLAQEYSLSTSDLMNLSVDNLSKGVVKVNSNSSFSFQKYLIQKDYKYQKGLQNLEKSISQDPIIKIEDKKYICLHLSRMNINNQKPNGIGQLILQYFKISGEQVKIINPLVVNKCEKWGDKKEYFKSKLKGLVQPESKRERRFNF